VAVLGGIDQILWFFIAVIIGSIVTMSVVLILRRQTPSLAVDTNNIEMGMDQSVNEIETEKNSVSTMDNQALEEQSVFSEQVIHISKQTLSRDEADRKSTRLNSS